MGVIYDTIVIRDSKEHIIMVGRGGVYQNFGVLGDPSPDRLSFTTHMTAYIEALCVL